MPADFVDPPVARQISMNAVTRVMLANGPTSRADIAKLTGLSKQTISDVVRSLEDAGWLKEGGRTSGKRGRSAITYELNGRAGLAVAIDLGGTKLVAAIGDLLGNIVAEATEPTDPRGGEALLTQIVRLVERLQAELGPGPARLRLAVLGTPGVFDARTGHIEIAPNVPGLGIIDVRGLLTARLGVPVIIENDVNLAARGEQWQGRATGVANFAFIALGTGIGMGIVAEGELLRGGRGAAGEIGYLPLGGDPYDPRGFRLGTFETAVGSAAIAARYTAAGGQADATVRDIFAASVAGEPLALAAIEETARLLAPAIAAIGAVLDPELVILGGSIGSREELVAAIRTQLQRCTPNPPRVEVSALGSRAGLTGALGVAVRHMHDDLFGVGFRPQQFGIRRQAEMAEERTER